MNALMFEQVSRGNIVRVYMDSCIAYHMLVEFQNKRIHLVVETAYGVHPKVRFAGFGNLEDFTNATNKISEDNHFFDILEQGTDEFISMENVVKAILIDHRASVPHRVVQSTLALETVDYIRV